MPGKSKLGIYLTSKKAILIEMKGAKIIKKHTLVFKEKQELDKPERGIMEKVNSFQGALKEIRTRDCFIGFPSEDLIIRSFFLPFMPSKEIPQALNFEAPRYVPFPLGELVYDFQYREDKPAKKIEVIFVGIKKEIFKQYNSIFEKIGLKVLSLEPGAFSIYRLLRYRKKINKRSSFGLIDVNGEEANFSIILNGLPFFNYQIKAPTLKKEESFFNFYSEIKIPLDYFRRQFRGKNIEKIFLLMEPPYIDSIKGLEEEIRIPLEVLEYKDLLGKDMKLNISELKALSLGLRSLEPRAISINLYKPNVLIERPIEAVPLKISLRRTALKVIIRPLIYVFLIIFIIFFLGERRISPLKRQLAEKEKEISLLKISPPFDTLSDLQNIRRSYQGKLRSLDREIERLKLKTMPFLDSISKIIPQGLWLEEFSLTETALRLRGLCYLGDEKKESDAVYKFLSSLKETDVFTQRFKEIKVISLTQEERERFSLTNFEISAK